MKKTFIRLMSAAFAFALLSVSSLALSAAPVYAGSSYDAACEGIGLTGSDGCGSDAESRVTTIITTVVDLLSWVVGIAAVIMIVLAGFKFVTSNGDSNGVASAKSTLIYALIGIVVVVLAQAIVAFVVTEV